IRDKLMSISPKGTTPIAYSIGKAESDFPEDSESRNIIILITDGIEMCNGDPCEISASLQKKGVALKPYIIGVDIDIKQADILACMGNYFDAANEKQFKQAINTIVAEVTTLTAVKVNLLDIKGNPTETNVALSFHDVNSGNTRYTYMHTMNAQGNPDTIYLDGLSQYKLKVHTVPPVYLDSINITEGKLNIIEVPAPQGTLLVDVKGDNPDDSNIKCIIRETGLPSTIHTIDADKKQKLLVGLYDLEILTLPRTYINAVKIEQSKLKKVSIEEPATIVINFRTPAIGTLLHEKGDILTDIYEFSPENSHYKLRLQPGYYRIIYRDGNAKSAKKSAEFRFRVVEGEMQVHNL
ncbi:MAG: VWA domain-containing protein, partial [Bacteroidales bacterium]|nr:VWA domain-containing protein [Bacteroidales bacterium]